MHIKTNASLAAIALLFSTNILAATYAEAEIKSIGHAADVKTSEWFESQMQPAFSPVFSPVMGGCLNSEKSRPARIDMVFIVKSTGDIGSFFWKEPNSFTDCLENGLKNTKFPAPPDEGFYFGVGFNLPPKRNS